jgi:hypothetical protein
MEASFIEEGTLSTGCGVQFHGMQVFREKLCPQALRRKRSA